MMHPSTQDFPSPPATAHATAPNQPDTILAMAEAHQNMLIRMCAALEEIADSLPFSIDVGHCLEAARGLRTAVSAATRFEEATFWPWAEDVLRSDDLLRDNFRRLHDEHRDDEDFAEELSAVLMDWSMSRARPNPETTGYMLRGFFVGLRRHLAFEREFLVRPLRASASLAGRRSPR